MRSLQLLQHLPLGACEQRWTGLILVPQQRYMIVILRHILRRARMV